MSDYNSMALSSKIFSFGLPKRAPSSPAPSLLKAPHEEPLLRMPLCAAA